MNAVHYYTVKREDSAATETDEFFSRLENADYGEPNVDYADELNKLVDWLQEIGEHRGAKKHYFRHEGAAAALPPPGRYLSELGHHDLHIRLYCYRISDKLVVLVNGDFKTPGPLTAQECPRVRPYFEQARRIAAALDRCCADKDWWPTGYVIDTFDDQDLEFEA